VDPLAQVPLPPYRKAAGALANDNLSLSIQELAYAASGVFPGFSTQVVYVSGAPFSKPYNDSKWSAATAKRGQKVTLSSLVDQIAGAEPRAPTITFSGGEPLMQSNSMRHLCKLLKQAFPQTSIRVETTGYYPEAISELGKNVDCVSLEVLAPLSPQAYSAATSFTHDQVLLFSAVQKAFAFLKLVPCIKEVVVPVADGVNDCPECLAAIAEEVSFVDRLVVKGVTAHSGSKFNAKRLVEHAKYACEFCPSVQVEYNGTRRKIWSKVQQQETAAAVTTPSSG
jgi:pyruvate-formate lyase-activating enzyme